MVREFRKNLGLRGVLFKDFQDTSDFVKIAKEDIWQLILDDWKNGTWSGVEISPETHLLHEAKVDSDNKGILSKGINETNQLPMEEDDEGFGLIELTEEFNKTISSLTTTLVRLRDHIRNIGKKFESHTISANNLTKNQGQKKPVSSVMQQQYLSAVKEIINDAAGDLDEFTTNMTKDLNQFKVDLEALLRYFKEITLTSQNELKLPSDRFLENKDALLELLKAMVGASQQVTSLQESIKSLPALTGKFRRARKNAAGVVGDLIATISLSIDNGNKMLATLNDKTN